MRARSLGLGFAMMITLATLAPGLALAIDTGGWTGAGLIRASGGRYFTDALGRRLELHGVNLVGKCGGGAVATPAAGTPCVGPAQGPNLAYVLSPTAADPARRFTAADAHTLALLGFNIVRLGVIWEGLEPGPPGVGPNDARYCGSHRRGTPFPSLAGADPYDAQAVQAYLARSDQIVALLSQAGIRVVIDMHQDAWGSAFFYGLGPTPWNGEGAPPWATCTNHVAFTPPTGWGSAYLARAVRMAIHHFWLNDVRGDLQGQYARVWQAVASHYSNSPDVVGYDVYNEPNDTLAKHFDSELQCDYGGPVREPRSCALGRPDALPDGLIGAIEGADPNHLVLFEPSGGSIFGGPETIGIAVPLRFPRLALAFHVYGPAATQLPEVASERFRTRTKQPGGPPSIMDEFGASNHSANIARMVSLADGGNLSWVYWSALQLDDPTGADPVEGLLDEQTHAPIPAQARALAVPYPWATAGTPGPQSFNRATRAFSFAYSVDRTLRAPTEISLPAYTYPHGYRVTVAGATVVSAGNSPLLQLLARPSATQVAVTVRALR